MILNFINIFQCLLLPRRGHLQIFPCKNLATEEPVIPPFRIPISTLSEPINSPSLLSKILHQLFANPLLIRFFQMPTFLFNVHLLKIHHSIRPLKITTRLSYHCIYPQGVYRKFFSKIRPRVLYKKRPLKTNLSLRFLMIFCPIFIIK